MMIPLNSERELALMRPAGAIAQTVLDEVSDFIRPGVTTRPRCGQAVRRFLTGGATVSPVPLF